MRKKTQTDVEQGFLSRWSAKKSLAEKADTQTEPAHDDDIISQPDRAEDNTEKQPIEAAENEQAVLTDEDMPDIETLDEKSDYSGFLSPGVSEELRKLALRKLFRSQAFNVRDGLDDYDDDFRSFAALGDLITSDMKHQMELAQAKEDKAREEKAREERAREERAREERAREERAKEDRTREEQDQQELAEQQDAAGIDDDDGKADKHAGEDRTAGADTHQADNKPPDAQGGGDDDELHNQKIDEERKMAGNNHSESGKHVITVSDKQNSKAG